MNNIENVIPFKQACVSLSSEQTIKNGIECILSLIQCHTFDEKARLISEWFCRIGLQDVCVDGECNVCGTYKSEVYNHKTIALCAHYDTVLAYDANTFIGFGNSAIYGIGSADNGSGLRTLIQLAQTIVSNALFKNVEIKFIATFGEECGGCCKGAQFVADNYNVDYAIVVDGILPNTIIVGGESVVRSHVYLANNSERSNRSRYANCAIQACNAIVKLERYARQNNYTFNVGSMVTNNEGPSSKPSSIEFDIELRSKDRDINQEEIKALITHVCSQCRHIDVNFTDCRLYGAKSTNERLLNAVYKSYNAVYGENYCQTLTEKYTSSDCNPFLVKQVPTIGVSGGGESWNTHTRKEKLVIDETFVKQPLVILNTLYILDQTIDVSS